MAHRITAAQRVAHDVEVQRDPDGHPPDCATCLAIAQQENDVDIPELEQKIAAAEAAATAATEAAAAAEQRAEDAEKRAKAAEEQLAGLEGDEKDRAHAAALAAKDVEIDAALAEVRAAEQRAADAEAALAERDKADEEAEAKRLADEALAAKVAERREALKDVVDEERLDARAAAYAEVPDDQFEIVLADLKEKAGPARRPAATARRIPGASSTVLGGSTADASEHTDTTDKTRRLLAGRRSLT